MNLEKAVESVTIRHTFSRCTNSGCIASSYMFPTRFTTGTDFTSICTTFCTYLPQCTVTLDTHIYKTGCNLLTLAW